MTEHDHDKEVVLILDRDEAKFIAQVLHDLSHGIMERAQNGEEAIHPLLILEGIAMHQAATDVAARVDESLMKDAQERRAAEQRRDHDQGVDRR